MDSLSFSPPTSLMSGKSVFVTGAGANIGRAIALEMATQGAAVFFADIDSARCEKLESELLELGAQAKGFVADLSCEIAIAKLHAQLQKADVRVDTLINNVGVHESETPDSARWWQSRQSIYNTNVLGPCYLTKLLTDDMIAKKTPGNVLFISSIHQWEVHGDVGYSSSKAALSMVVRELAMQLAAHQIRVNSIAPGYVAENASGQAVAHPPTPLGGTSIPPHFIARAAVYLCSEYFSNHTTGSILTLDGGLSLHNHLTAHLMGGTHAGSTPGASKSPLNSLARKFRRAFQPSTL